MEAPVGVARSHNYSQANVCTCTYTTHSLYKKIPPWKKSGNAVFLHRWHPELRRANNILQKCLGPSPRSTGGHTQWGLNTQSCLILSQISGPLWPNLVLLDWQRLPRTSETEKPFPAPATQGSFIGAAARAWTWNLLHTKPHTLPLSQSIRSSSSALSALTVDTLKSHTRKNPSTGNTKDRRSDLLHSKRCIHETMHITKRWYTFMLGILRKTGMTTKYCRHFLHLHTTRETWGQGTNKWECTSPIHCHAVPDSCSGGEPALCAPAFPWEVEGMLMAS